MPDLRITNARMPTPPTCKCGKTFHPNDISEGVGSIELVCAACHSAVMQIEFDGPDGDDEWD